MSGFVKTISFKWYVKKTLLARSDTLDIRALAGRPELHEWLWLYILAYENVIRFDHRPFETVEEMDAELVRRWNVKVKPGDLVYVLGDLIWRSRTDDAYTLIRSMNGQIILIKGNHDHFLHNAKAKNALAGVKDYDDISVTLEDGTMRRCILSHYFIPMYNGHRYGAIHLHGHSHVTDEAAIERDIAKRLNGAGYLNEIYNVGCMYWDYAPVTLDEILAAGTGFETESSATVINTSMQAVRMGSDG